MSGIRTKDGILFNPTQNGKKYISLFYHRGSGNRNVKNFWHNDITPDIEYSIFQFSDTTNSCCSQGHYWGIQNQGNQVLGHDGERICKFPANNNPNNPWHGYPVETKDHAIEEKIVSAWLETKVISRSIARRIRKRLL